jgi:bifunctional dethiobiotin synthetase / adenosylmethionine---8-amino-7-oxononanoate aminotransferase
MLRGSSLHRHLLTYQLYGANTDVGKTIFSTILCKALALARKKTWYLKPVSTGPLDEADNAHIHVFAPQTATKCLFQFGLAVSPHIAAAAEGSTREVHSRSSVKVLFPFLTAQ